MSHFPESHARRLRLVAALGALATGAAVHAQTLRLYVDAAAPVGGTGLSWNSALRDLQSALAIANGRSNHSLPAEIRIAQGIYTPDSGTHNRALSFTVGSGVSLFGGFIGLVAGVTGDPGQNDPARFVSVLSGDLLHNDGPADATRTDNSYLLVKFADGLGSSIDGLTFRSAAAAILGSPGVAYQITRCIITDNVATSGTVANIASPLPIITTAGGLSECTIVNNRATLAPILVMNGGVVRRCTIAGNLLSQDTLPLPVGAAALQIGNGSWLDACLIFANSSDTLNLSTACGVPVYNCTIADNRCPASPGISGCALTIYNCIFFRNVATAAPGPTWPQVTGYGPYLLNCFLDHGLGDVQATGGTITGNQTVSGNPGFVNPSGPDADPTTWQDNDYRLNAGSQCVDHGDSLYIPNGAAHLDLFGHSAFDDPGAPNTGSGPIAYVDLGAIERAPTPCRADFDHNGVLNPTDIMNFISAWLSGNMAADFDNSGALTAHDVLEFISVWFQGC